MPPKQKSRNMLERDCGCEGREGRVRLSYSDDKLSEHAEVFINPSWNTQLSCHLSGVSNSAFGVFCALML